METRKIKITVNLFINKMIYLPNLIILGNKTLEIIYQLIDIISTLN